MLYLMCKQVVESGLQILVVKEGNVWIPFFDISQYVNQLNSFMIIILNTIYGWFAT